MASNNIYLDQQLLVQPPIDYRTYRRPRDIEPTEFPELSNITSASITTSPDYYTREIPYQSGFRSFGASRASGASSATPISIQSPVHSHSVNSANGSENVNHPYGGTPFIDNGHVHRFSQATTQYIGSSDLLIKSDGSEITFPSYYITKFFENINLKVNIDKDEDDIRVNVKLIFTDPITNSETILMEDEGTT